MKANVQIPGTRSDIESVEIGPLQSGATFTIPWSKLRNILVEHRDGNLGQGEYIGGVRVDEYGVTIHISREPKEQI